MAKTHGYKYYIEDFNMRNASRSELAEAVKRLRDEVNRRGKILQRDYPKGTHGTIDKRLEEYEQLKTIKTRGVSETDLKGQIKTLKSFLSKKSTQKKTAKEIVNRGKKWEKEQEKHKEKTSHPVTKSAPTPEEFNSWEEVFTACEQYAMEKINRYPRIRETVDLAFYQQGSSSARFDGFTKTIKLSYSSNSYYDYYYEVLNKIDILVESALQEEDDEKNIRSNNLTEMDGNFMELNDDEEEWMFL